MQKFFQQQMINNQNKAKKAQGPKASNNKTEVVMSQVMSNNQSQRKIQQNNILHNYNNQLMISNPSSKNVHHKNNF